MGTVNKDRARFDTRLLKEQKELFERAAMLGGYKNLSEFVITTVHNKAKEIIDESERIIASQKDREIFFNALMNPPKPNQYLISALDDFNNLAAE